LLGDAELLGDSGVGLPLSAVQDDACAKRQRLRGLPSSRPGFESGSFTRAHGQTGYRSSSSHASHPPRSLLGIRWTPIIVARINDSGH
jgi:hypothetical protein